MGNVYIEARPKGRPDHSPIDDFVVEDGADRILAAFKTPARGPHLGTEGHSPLVARVRHLNDKDKPDHWRAA
jgi:hypothetical protein